MIYRLLSFASTTLLVVCAGCSSLSLDLATGRQAETRGDMKLAERHYSGLAYKGHPDAMIEYGDLLRDRGTDTSLAEAEKWYKRALDYAEFSSRANQRLAKLYLALYMNRARDDKERYIESAQRHYLALFENRPFESYTNLLAIYHQHWQGETPPKAAITDLSKMMSERGEVFAVFAQAAELNINQQEPEKALRLCNSIINRVIECYIENTKAAKALGGETLAQHIETLLNAYESGILSERNLANMSNLLAQGETVRVGAAEKLLRRILQDNPEYAYHLAKLFYYNDSDIVVEEVLTLLEGAGSRGDMRAHYLLGRIYLEGKLLPIDPEKSLFHLQQCAGSIANAELMIGNIYYEGFLGRSEPQKAMQHFLSAARRGVVAADYELAKMFWFGRGNLINVEYAVSFITLARKRTDAESVAALFDKIYAESELQSRTDGLSLYKEEESYRNASRVSGVW